MDGLDAARVIARFVALTDAERAAQASLERIAMDRARLVAALHADGLSYAEIGRLLVLSRARVQQLVEKARKPAL